MSTEVATEQGRTPAIQVRGLEKSYKDNHVLRGVDFDVAPGTVFAPARLHSPATPDMVGYARRWPGSTQTTNAALKRHALPHLPRHPDQGQWCPHSG